MRRVALVFGVWCLLLAASADGASAASAHFKKGSPTFNDLGLSLRENVKLSGLGGGDLVVSLTATAIPTVTCSNPGGGTQPPGQNPVEVTVGSGEVSIPSNQIKNGTVSFGVTTVAPPSEVAGAPECPNANWTETITDLAFTSASISINQAGQALSLDGTSCTFAPQTVDGAVPTATVSC